MLPTPRQAARQVSLTGRPPPDQSILTLAERRILLICPPFQRLSLSPLAIALLATFLRHRGVDCTEAYLQFELARLVGAERYRQLGEGTRGLDCELLFAEGLHGRLESPDAQARLAELFGSPAERSSIRRDFEARCLRRLADVEPDLVGLTTSNNQLVPALWLTRIIKRARPSVRVVLGGSSCAEPMGQRILEAYPEVDWVVSGYGETPLLDLARGGEPGDGLVRSHEPVDLDGLPVPDYGPYLRAVEDFGGHPSWMLTFETSRGCWWGQKAPCTFCGLNGLEMAYHKKSSARVVSEIRTLWKRHGRNLFATDAILSREHLRQVMPELGRFETGPRIFYEVKANLREADVVALGRANVVGLQPGIESLSTHLLRLLHKGTDAIHNLALLKWCRERHIALGWNLLCGIPGEEPADYEQQVALLRKVPHFPPPVRANPIRVDRYSPYFDHYREFGWSDIEPLPEYRMLHPQLGEAMLRDLAYHFCGIGGVSAGGYLGRLEREVETWQRRYRRGEGLFLDPVEGLVRNDAERGFRFHMNDTMARVLECTHQVAPIARVLEHARCTRAVLEQMAAHDLVYLEGNRVLNLTTRTALPRD
jgi:ribosomal peptide maturation radical SAM protein 1